MAGEVLSKRRLYALLKAAGHKPLNEYSHGVNTHRWWKTPWGEPFSVPDDDETCGMHDLAFILQQVEKTKP